MDARDDAELLRRSGAKKASAAASDDAEAQDDRITRKKWPVEPEKRVAAIKFVLPQAISDYYGNPIVIASALSVTPREIEMLIAEDPALSEQQLVAKTTAEALLEDRLLHLALHSNNASTLRFMLERRSPDRWAPDKTAKRKGNSDMKLPDELPPSTLSKGEKS